MKWKDWFYFTKGQRIGVIVLLVLISLTMLFHWSIRFFIPDNTLSSDLFEQQAKQFLDSLQTLPDAFELHRQPYSSVWTHEPHSKSYPALPAAVLFQFNPNELDSAGFVKLGLKPYIASNILKYRAKGGKFRKPDDFSKVWGVTPEKLNELLPYIVIPTDAIEPTASALPSRIAKKDVVLEINSTDTLQLQQISGIGSGYAKRIVAYRNRLGGYVNVAQLAEIWGMTPALFAQISPHFTVNPQLISKIPINRASVERLMSHPYLNFSKAKAIYELRRSKGKLTSIDQLKTLAEMDPSTISKVEPYLSFE